MHHTLGREQLLYPRRLIPARNIPPGLLLIESMNRMNCLHPLPRCKTGCQGEQQVQFRVSFISLPRLLMTDLSIKHVHEWLLWLDHEEPVISFRIALVVSLEWHYKGQRHKFRTRQQQQPEPGSTSTPRSRTCDEALHEYRQRHDRRRPPHYQAPFAKHWGL